MISRITLFITASCPVVMPFQLAYDVLGTGPNEPGSTDPAVAAAPIQVTIAATESSNPACVAIPGVVTIPRASFYDSAERTPAGTDPTTNPEVNPDPAKVAVSQGSLQTQATVNLVVRPRAARACSYTITYPRSSSALTLKAENGYTRDDRTTSLGDNNNPSFGDPNYEFNPSGDGNFDGSVTYEAEFLTARTTAPITFLYETRKLPISVSMNFPDVVFTTEDEVRFRISIVGECARYSTIIARALGATGTFRSVQAYSGTTIVFDRSLRDIESDNSQAGELLFDVEPVVTINGERFPCKVEVEELATPNGCTVIGSNPQELEFAENLEAFAFDFAHTCSGLPTSGGGRGITG